MRPLLVVPLEEASKALTSVLRAGEDLEVEAFTEHGADPALRLAVGLGVVRAREAVAELRHAADASPGLGAIRIAVVGEQAVDADALLPEPAQRANQEVGRGPTPLVAEHLRVHQTAAIVDGHVQHFPADAAVVRRPDATWGEVPIAFVARRDASLSADELRARCRAELAGYKQPKDIVFIAYEDFPRSASGKVQRHELEKRLRLRKRDEDPTP